MFLLLGLVGLSNSLQRFLYFTIAIIRAYICYLSVGELVYCEMVYYNYMIKKVEDVKDLKVPIAFSLYIIYSLYTHY